MIYITTGKHSLSHSDKMEPIPGAAAGANPLLQFSDFELHDFIADPNFNQFVDLIRGEHEDPVVNFDLDLIKGSFAHTGFGASPEFGFDSNAVVASYPNSVFEGLASFDAGEMNENEGEEEDDNDGDDSSATTTTMAIKGTKLDRSRTLISERRRRGRMKEKLYALRSLVPNITKMDKASIVGDAVLHVKELQMQAKKLKSEIAVLEASMAASGSYQGSTENPNKKTQAPPPSHSLIVQKKIIEQMDVFQVEERGFYVRLVCERGEGAAIALYRVLESLANFNLQSSNLAMASERLVLTATMNVRDCEQDINLPNLKLWVAGALLNQGFEFKP